MSQIKKTKRIYLMGICGTGMAALAGLLQEKGYQVCGSDSGCYEPMNSVLKRLGIKVFKGYKAQNVIETCPDLVIIGNVITKDNPEACYVLGNDIPYMSFPEAMGHFFLSEKRPLVVTGTHGKTTTSTLLLSALEACNLEPGFMIGGVPLQKKRGFGTGTGEWFVIEGDEYDSSFFQKVSKFLFYKPFGAIITSIEFDHADIFNSLQQIKESFSKFASLLPRKGILVVCRDWNTVMEAACHAKCKVITYGLHEKADWRLRNVEIGEKNTTFWATDPNGQNHKVEMKLPGKHNALNALSVMALCHSLGLNLNPVIKGISGCPGIRRRQEIKGIIGNITVIDDFAHHPRAVQETLEALKGRYKGSRLIAIFEPRTNTSRRAVFQSYYVSSFDHADKIFVRQVPDPEKAPENDRFSSQKLVDDLRERGKKAFLCDNATDIINQIIKDMRSGDVYVVLSNGPFEQIHERLLDKIREQLS